MTSRIHDLDVLRTFLQIAESGSLTKAGRALDMPTTLVSRHLARLESHLGVRLATRTTRRFNLTEEGRRLYELGLPLVEQADAAVASLQPGSPLEGELRVAMTAILAEQVRQGMFAALRAHPELRLQIVVTDEPAAQVVRHLADRGLHGVLLVGVLPEVSIIARRLTTISAVLAAHPEYLERHGTPERPSDLSDHQCLCYIGDRIQRVWGLVDEDGAEVSVRVGGRFSSTSSVELRAALVEGFGIGPTTPQQIVDSGLVRVLPAYHFSKIPIWLGYLEHRRNSPKVRALEELLRSSFANSTVVQSMSPGS
ncbi:MAG: LysR family transcriptional regulator [Myxococcota bacterium]